MALIVLNDPNGEGDNPNLVGTTFADDIRGLGGNDVINPLSRVSDTGAFEGDEVDGGSGIDTLLVDASSETVRVEAFFLILAGEYTLFSASPINFSVTAQNIEKVNITGGSGNDSLSGLASDDILRGGIGLDVLSGGDGIDLLEGGSGDDTLSGGLGNDTLDGGTHSLNGDTASYATATQGIVVNLGTGQATGASIGTDTLISIETVIGGSGADDMTGGGAEDTFRGSAGNDELFGGGEDDKLFGDANNDILLGGVGSDQLQGGDGNDIIVGGPDFDLIDGDAGVDTVDYTAESALNNVNITVNLSAESASFEGFPTDGEAVVDIEIVFTGGGDDELIGNSAGNGLSGGGGLDTLKGNGGNDILLGGDDHDELYGHAGDDDLEGGEGVDRLEGGANRDVLLGGDDGDILLGGGDGDTLNGGEGGDDLEGGAAPDRLTGGLGNDDFIFRSVSDSKRGSFSDTILDFKRGQDDIDLKSIDADTSKNSGNDKFKFIGKDAFKGGGGELRYIDKGSTCLVQADVNGDKDADLEILVKVGSLSSSDFIL